jgi:hypothetical protein
LIISIRELETIVLWIGDDGSMTMFAILASVLSVELNDGTIEKILRKIK